MMCSHKALSIHAPSGEAAPLPSDNSVQTLAPISPATLVRFDVATAWKRLSPVQQSQIGAAAMIYAVGVWRADRINTVVGWDAAEYEGARRMAGFVHNALGEDRIASLPLPDLAPIGVRACRVCGCTEDCACPGGCRWVAPGLCSSCAPALVEAAADLPPALWTFIERDSGTVPDDDHALNACLKAGLVGIYSGHNGMSAWFATDYAKLLRDLCHAAKGVEVHD